MSLADPFDKYVRLAMVRGKHYVVFKSNAIQRWAARQVAEGKDYSTLTSTFWRRAKLDGIPLGADTVMEASSTYYFNEEQQAESAAIIFLARMRELEVI